MGKRVSNLLSPMFLFDHELKKDHGKIMAKVKDMPDGYIYDLGFEAHAYRPWTFDEEIEMCYVGHYDVGYLYMPAKQMSYEVIINDDLQ